MQLYMAAATFAAKTSAAREAEAFAFTHSFVPSPRFLGVPPAMEVAFPRTPGHPWWGCPSWRGVGPHCGIEWDEWMMIDALITPRHTVLELGGRFGTSSCRLARATNNSGQVVTVEPDERVQSALLLNRDVHRCNFHVIKGTVSDMPLAIGPMGSYNQRTVESGAAQQLAGTQSKRPRALPNFHIADIEERIGARINAALIDCEGCIGHVLAAPGLLERLELILLEEDMYTRKQMTPAEAFVDYGEYYAKLRAAGFAQVWRSHDTFLPDSKNWSKFMLHSAWRRGPRLGGRASRGNACVAHSRATRLPPQLICCARMGDPFPAGWDSRRAAGAACVGSGREDE